MTTAVPSQADLLATIAYADHRPFSLVTLRSDLGGTRISF
jgi:hypothetical protein